MPRYLKFGATDGETLDELCFQLRRTMGHSADLSSFRSWGDTRQCLSISSRVATITAKGLERRLFLLLKRFIASSLVASQASWNPPRPRSARILPALRSSPAASIASSHATGFPLLSTSAKLGPHWGQALGWA
ncbi:hypothetical protein ES707_14908 [subsurface metagenome]